MKFKDLSGEKFGCLTAIKKVDNTISNGRSFVNYLCVCDCGKEKIVKAENLRSGNTKSCGCLSDYSRRTAQLKHGMAKSRLYSIYRSAINRCYNKNHKYYSNYGGRGISFCDEWIGEYGFEHFASWAYKNGYCENLSLDRINNELDYSPDNCKWSTMKEQANNRRNNRLYEYNGEFLTISQLSEKYNIPYDTIRARLVKYGFSVYEAVNVVRCSKKRRYKFEDFRRCQ